MRWALIGFGVLVGISMLAAIVAPRGSSRQPAAAPTHAAVPTWTATPAPATPEPATATPEPQRAIALPVATAEPPTAAPAATAAYSCAGGCTVQPDPSCAIKGNVNGKGDRIYHAPGWLGYRNVKMQPAQGDRWFCTEAEAQAAGFRASQK